MMGGHTIREIDKLIHIQAYDPSPASYKKRQLELLPKISGCEVALFNDPTVYYLEHRPHLSGKTGTMTNILTGTFYYLYNSLISNPEIDVNVRADLVTLFYALVLMKGQRIPREDEEIIRAIIRNLLERAETLGEPLLSMAWWDTVPSRVAEIIAKHSKGNQQMWRIFQDLMDGASVFEFGPYENTVEYVPHDFRMFETQITKMEELNPILDFVRGFFKSALAPVPEDSAPPENNLIAFYEAIKGGSRYGKIPKKMTRRRHTQRNPQTKHGKRKVIRSRAQRNQSASRR
jgi:hypothetical protein